MPTIRYTTTTDFSELAAGVFIAEQTPPAVATGASIRTPGIVGECVRGPVDDPIAVTSTQQLLNIFGGRDTVSNGAFTGDVYKALLNKTNGRVVVVRAAAAAATAATATFNDTATPVLQVDASSVGTWGNGVTIDIVAASDGDANKFDLIARWRANESGAGGQVQRFTNLDISTGINNLAARVGDSNTNLVTLTKLADGRPDDVSGTALTTGSNGTIADTDFTGTGRALDKIATATGVGHVHVAGRSTTAIKTAMASKASASNDRLYLIGPDDETVTLADAITELGTLSRSDRLVYCFNHPLTLDPDTSSAIVTEPMDWMSNALARLDVEFSPAIRDVAEFYGGIIRLSFQDLTDGDYDSAFAAGISALERDVDSGFLWRDGVTTFLPDGTDRNVIPRRRSVDFLLQNIARLAKNDVNKPNTSNSRSRRAAAYRGFLGALQREERIVDRASDGESDGFIVDLESGNDPAQRALGIQKDIIRVRRIPEQRIINIISEIGTTVTINVTNNGATEV